MPASAVTPAPAPRRDLFVYVASIVLIVGAAVYAFAAFSMAGGLILYDQIVTSATKTQLENWPSRQALGLLLASYTIDAALFLVAGILGVRGASILERAPRLLAWAVVVVVFHLVALIVGFQHGSGTGEILGFAAAVLFLVATIIMRKRAGSLPRNKPHK